VLTWGEFERTRPDLARAGRELFQFFGVGLGILATVRKDGGPRVHPVCPVIAEAGLFAFLIPSPKLQDLKRDARFALHSYPLPHNEDVFYLTGQARVDENPESRRKAESIYFDERNGAEAPAGFDEQALVQFFIESCLLTRTSGHGDAHPEHTIWTLGRR
jgi:hypothetical protein